MIEDAIPESVLNNMIRVIVLFLLLSVGATGSGRAQAIQWGASASLSFHRLEFEEPLPWWSDSGLVYPGVMLHGDVPLRFIEGPLGKMLWFSSGIRYVRLASEVDFELVLGEDEQLFSGKFRIMQHYASVPLHFRLDLGTAPVYLLGGPELAFLLFAARKSETFTPVESQVSTTQNVTEGLKRINVSIYGGIGVHIGSRFDLYARYGKGLTNVLKGGEETVSDSDWSTKEVEFGFKVDFGR